uniref:ATP synthase subunit a n=1 Tax=Echinoderes svetlanae TaxID=1912903 RepID=A0A1I9VTU6_9BILA|nr:ATP synthase F0 subunit 6 [Echinoderes svetlanae]APA17419.1 ATP synthase F0 subunit 6 [Echinoderes svetlanae]
MLFSCLEPGYYFFSGGLSSLMLSVVGFLGFMLLVGGCSNMLLFNLNFNVYEFFYEGVNESLESSVSGGSYVYGRSGWGVILFSCLLSFNFMSLLPFVYGGTSLGHVTVISGLILWLSSILSSSYEFFVFWFTHLVPDGVPMVLSWFMVLVELVSIMIRPLTLSVRLMANISVGHLLLSLAGLFCLVVSGGMIYGKIIIWLLILLELLTAFMQAYVFTLLGWVYILESDH